MAAAVFETGADLSTDYPNRLATTVAAGTLAVVTVTLLIASLLGRPHWGAALAHGGVFALVALAAARGGRIRNDDAQAVVTAVLIIGSMFFLYTSLGQVAFTAIPWDGDVWARDWDRWLAFGTEPVVSVAAMLEGRPLLTEVLAFFYAMFIPYLYLSIFLGLAGRPAKTRALFVLGFSLLYGVSFMGYLFVPARGPVVAMQDVLTVPLDGGYFHAIVLRSIELAGGPHGAFPSLHVGASTFAMLVDFRHGDRLRALIYVPLVAFICMATVALRYHYVVDIYAGLFLAWAAVRLAERWAPRSPASATSSGG